MILESYYQTVIQRDLLNKFRYQTIKQIPRLKCVHLNFGCKINTIRNISAALLALELLTGNQPQITKSRKMNLVLKLRKGQPTGCSTILLKKDLYRFLDKLNLETLPLTKSFNGFSLFTKPKSQSKSFSILLSQLINFSELEDHFYLFSQLPKLTVTFSTNAPTTHEFIVLVKALKLPIKI